ncbi:hypothetical protein Acr_29g0011290 [Actinidia rufa]|uniref:Uncharacterized protein n=1 Tax=Actinidia rufa TaxID=165716 RepID=A0A7J0HFQ7_9ERIC|nr:hypothetical protein Acr_29g0011290 [Actinidia rufa]
MLRTTRTALSEADIANEYSLGVPGEAFAFSQCQNKVTVTGASGLTGEISQLELFIRETREGLISYSPPCSEFVVFRFKMRLVFKMAKLWTTKERKERS